MATKESFRRKAGDPADWCWRCPRCNGPNDLAWDRRGFFEERRECRYCDERVLVEPLPEHTIWSRDSHVSIEPRLDKCVVPTCSQFQAGGDAKLCPRHAGRLNQS